MTKAQDSSPCFWKDHRCILNPTTWWWSSLLFLHCPIIKGDNCFFLLIFADVSENRWRRAASRWTWTPPRPSGHRQVMVMVAGAHHLGQKAGASYFWSNQTKQTTFLQAIFLQLVKKWDDYMECIWMRTKPIVCPLAYLHPFASQSATNSWKNLQQQWGPGVRDHGFQ